MNSDVVGESWKQDSSDIQTLLGGLKVSSKTHTHPLLPYIVTALPDEPTLKLFKKHNPLLDRGRIILYKNPHDTEETIAYQGQIRSSQTLEGERGIDDSKGPSIILGCPVDYRARTHLGTGICSRYSRPKRLSLGDDDRELFCILIDGPKRNSRRMHKRWPKKRGWTRKSE